MGLIIKAIKSKQKELSMSLLMVMILLLVSSTLMLLIEKPHQPGFSTIVDGLWWGVATLTTVGYGDLYPITPAGKLLGGLIAILGVGLFALPAGMIASGFVEIMQEQQKMDRLKELEEKIYQAFFIEYFSPVIKIKKKLGISHLPRKWLSVPDIKYKMMISEEHILELVQFSPYFKLSNVKLNEQMTVGLELVGGDRPYGLYKNRQSPITLINLYSATQPYFSHLSMVLADMMDANHIANTKFTKHSFLEKYRLNTVINESYFKPLNHPILSELSHDMISISNSSEFIVFMINAASNENMLQIEWPLRYGDLKDQATTSERIQTHFSSMASEYEMIAKHKERTSPIDEYHVARHLNERTGKEPLFLYINVGFLKKKAPIYYTFIHQLSNALSAFINEDIKQ